MKESYITAIEMPGNIQKPFYNLQNELFKRYRTPTARLFPPIAPLFPDRLTADMESKIKTVCNGIECFSAEPVIFFHDPVFCSPFCSVPRFGLVSPFSRNPLPFPGLNFPDTPAIFLSALQGSPYTPKDIETTIDEFSKRNARQPVRWKTMNVVEIALTVTDQHEWWREITWRFTKSVTVTCAGK